MDFYCSVSILKQDSGSGFTTQKAAEFTEEQFNFFMFGLNPLDPKIKEMTLKRVSPMERLRLKRVNLEASRTTSNSQNRVIPENILKR